MLQFLSGVEQQELLEGHPVDVLQIRNSSDIRLANKLRLNQQEKGEVAIRPSNIQ